MASREWEREQEIEMRLRALLTKIVKEEHTPQEYAEHQYLIAERGKLMHPRLSRQRPNLCDRLQRRLHNLS